MFHLHSTLTSNHPKLSDNANSPVVMDENPRIQKLLWSEYQELALDPVLLESPFAETTRDGRGVRQVALGLTRSRLIVATDVFRNTSKVFYCHKNVDPSIESLELLSVYPVELVALSVFRRRHRQTLKARLIDGRARYYELGGSRGRSSRWISWCEHVQALTDRRRFGSSLSETSAAASTSTSGTTCPIPRTRLDTSHQLARPRWTQRDLYLGPLHSGNYTPEKLALSHRSLEGLKDQLRDRSPKGRPKISYPKKMVRKLFRCGRGVDENCISSLCLEVRDVHRLVDDGVLVWEMGGTRRGQAKRRRDISTAPHFLDGLGPWSVQPGERRLLSLSRRSRSCVAIRRQPVELRLPISRRQLRDSVSLAELPRPRCGGGGAVLFWTPNYWYRPRDRGECYRETREHLAGLRRFQERRPARCRYRGPVAGLRHRLKLDHPRLSIWDLESVAIARQLGLVDRVLFIRVAVGELEVAVEQRTSRGAPNVAAWVAFGHRVSCLVASGVVDAGGVSARARLVARLVNAASRCLRAGNRQSAASVLAGLQSPAVYRLSETWAHLRAHHAARYALAEKLGESFGSREAQRTRTESDALIIVPSIGDVLARYTCTDAQDMTKNRLSTRDWLLGCQRRARGCEFSDHSLAREFLLKARYREDKENFYISLRLESGSKKTKSC